MEQEKLSQALQHIFRGIEILKENCPHGRNYTIDGRLVGDIGEIIAAREFEIELDPKSRAKHDAKTPEGRDVQIKATFKDSFAFRGESDLYLCIKLFPNGDHEVVYNGPLGPIKQAFGHLKNFGVEQLSFSAEKLRNLAREVPQTERIPRRKQMTSKA
jgi:hypothetical protein